MRILIVVTYVSPDGAFGGPVSVALAHAAGLADRGHEVVVLAGGPVRRRKSEVRDGFTLTQLPVVRLSRKGGFATLASPALWFEVARRRSSFEVIHVHLARDLVTLPVGALASVLKMPIIVQTHGMIDPTRKAIARPLDALVTRPVLRAARRILSLTSREEADLAAVEPRIRVSRIGNAVRPRAKSSDMGEAAHERTVLFLARLHSRKRPVAFVQMAHILVGRFPDVQFVVAGPDEGQGAIVEETIRAAGIEDRVKVIGGLSSDGAAKALSRASVYVLPSENEVFPMTMIEAFSLGTPVVTTDTLAIADQCRQYGAALLCDGSPAALAKDVTELLLNDQKAEAVVQGAYKYVREELDLAKVIDTLERHYMDAAGV